MAIHGTKHDGNLTGTPGDDVFFLYKGGNDTASGGGNADYPAGADCAIDITDFSGAAPFRLMHQGKETRKGKIMQRTHHRTSFRMLPALATAIATLVLWNAQAQAGPAIGYRVLHTFCQSVSCADGVQPSGDQLVRDAGGDLFGVATAGGRFNDGTLFELFPKHGGARYFKKVLKAFCEDSNHCPAGENPVAGLVMDTSGNLYGTTQFSPASSCGVAYEAVRGAKVEMKTLHIFIGKGSDGCPTNVGSFDYQGKESGQLYDGTSPLYGATGAGGANGLGVVYELIPPKPGHGGWQQKVIHSFCSAGNGCSDGAQPYDNLVMDASGDLFGTTGNGRIFELVPDGSGGFSYNVIYTTATNESYFTLRIEADGTLVGVALFGGATGNGTLYKLAPDGGGGFQYTLLHDFCAGDCSDGEEPDSVLIDANGNIFGTTTDGGPNAAPPGTSPYIGAGVIYEYSSGGSFSVLHNFCAQANCADGSTPFGGLVGDGNGNFFGTAIYGGSTAHTPSGGGVVYELSF